MLMLLLMLGLIVLKISFFAQISMSISNNQLPLIAEKFGLDTHGLGLSGLVEAHTRTNFPAFWVT